MAIQITTDLPAGAPRPVDSTSVNPPVQPWILLFIVVLAGALAFVPVAGGVRMMWLARGMPTWLRDDLDTGLIHQGLLAAPRLRDTLSWWTGIWVGQVPFYRPLTSYAFWIEWKLFGDREWLYLIPTVAAHLLATAAFTALAFFLARRWRLSNAYLAALLVGFVFSGLLNGEVHTGVWSVVLAWKNQPDGFAGLCSFLALCCYLHAQDRKQGVPWAAAGLYLCACGFKEIAVPLPGLCLLLEWGRFRGAERRAVVSRLLTMGAVTLAFLALRWWALSGGLGYRLGSNRSWLGRSLIHALGPFGDAVLGGSIGPLEALWIGLVLLVTVMIRGRLLTRGRLTVHAVPWLWLAAVLVLLVGAGMLGAWIAVATDLTASWAHTAGPLDFWVIGLLFAFTGEPLASLARCLLLMALVWSLARKYPQALVFCVGWTLLYLAPIAISPGPAHRYYVPEGGMVLIYGLGYGVLLTAGMTALRPHLPPRIARLLPDRGT